MDDLALIYQELKLKREIAAHELQCLLEDKPDGWRDSAEDLISKLEIIACKQKALDRVTVDHDGR